MRTNIHIRQFVYKLLFLRLQGSRESCSPAEMWLSQANESGGAAFDCLTVCVWPWRWFSSSFPFSLVIRSIVRCPVVSYKLLHVWSLQVVGTRPGRFATSLTFTNIGHHSFVSSNFHRGTSFHVIARPFQASCWIMQHRSWSGAVRRILPSASQRV
jgi:hypothetical protein